MVRVYGAWIKTYHVLCSKHIASLAMCYSPPLVQRYAARSSCVCDTRLLHK